jgi:hypothetical protein
MDMISMRLIRRSCLMLLAAAPPYAGISTVAQAASADRLPALIGETSAQFQLAFRMHPNEARERQEQLDAAVAAWRAAPRTAASDERLAKWLRAAIRTSMPGQREALPPTPDFKTLTKVEKRIAEPARAESASSASSEKHTLEASTAAAPDTERTSAIESPAAADETTDPFRDDPLAEQE